MVKCYIGLGSNIGDREDYLHQALTKLDSHAQVRICRTSNIYETDPYGPVEQDPFLNMAIEVETSLAPEDLLKATQAIERDLKRERVIHWGPRTIDLDILLYADKMIETEHLIIPHPELTKRLFVIIPLNDLSPDLQMPKNGPKVKDLLAAFDGVKGVRLWKNNGAGEYGLFEN
ncbi:2-amino-4-hydroxy-6-hydroxymethyldihydropteridine diphosphokinase [Camelliibacillus cellulosilyticus]|uniref:2-amino-4-hydroxy-6-hydroxymethyldihydropteridine diphosphokinase n=1 Tax=Camelliibacillus cellulosilyticus TaxID=2174486 RepID=A0ABV9GQT4_9BACL